jgi:hypothetical protein
MEVIKMYEQHFICDLCNKQFNLAEVNQQVLTIEFDSENKINQCNFSNLDICESCAKKLENWIEENTVN